jgi:hypothetical protein
MARATTQCGHTVRVRRMILPLPKGEGRGEGKGTTLWRGAFVFDSCARALPEGSMLLSHS